MTFEEKKQRRNVNSVPNIPVFDNFFLPILKFHQDGKEHTTEEIKGYIANFYKLTSAEESALIPSGNRTKIHNRVEWTMSYLKKAKLLRSPRRSAYIITERGIRTIEENPNGITRKILKKFQEFREFQRIKDSDISTTQLPIDISTFEKQEEKKYEKIEKIPNLEKVLERALNAPKIPRTKTVTTEIAIRDPNVRRITILRAEGKCQMCGRKVFLIEAHIVALGGGFAGEDSLDNTAGLCDVCHRRLDSGLCTKRAVKMLLTKAAKPITKDDLQRWASNPC